MLNQNKIKLITANDFSKIQLGDEVFYREKSGEISPFLYRAKVIGVRRTAGKPLYYTLRCAAMLDPENSYEEADRYFDTTFAYTDCIIGNTGCNLFKAA